jgi:hypothetical protein
MIKKSSNCLSISAISFFYAGGLWIPENRRRTSRFCQVRIFIYHFFKDVITVFECYCVDCTVVLKLFLKLFSRQYQERSAKRKYLDPKRLKKEAVFEGNRVNGRGISATILSKKLLLLQLSLTQDVVSRGRVDIPTGWGT